MSLVALLLSDCQYIEIFCRNLYVILSIHFRSGKAITSTLNGVVIGSNPTWGHQSPVAQLVEHENKLLLIFTGMI